MDEILNIFQSPHEKIHDFSALDWKNSQFFFQHRMDEIHYTFQCPD